MKDYSGVYSIECIINKKMYIGYTTDISKRKSWHFNELKNNRHSNKYLQNSYNKYGKDNFIFELIDTCNNKELLPSLENYWCNILDTHNEEYGYNILPTSDFYGITSQSISSRQKCSNSHKKLYKEGYIHPMMGKKHKEESKLKMKESRTNRKVPYTGWNDKFKGISRSGHIVLDLNIGVYYDSIKEAFNYSNFSNIRTFRRMLSGEYKNKTSCIITN